MKGTCATREWVAPKVAQVDAGNGRLFLVITSLNPTASLVLQWDPALSCWTSIFCPTVVTSPECLVTGILMRADRLANPVQLLKRELALEKAANRRLMGEARREVRRKLRPGLGERGKRGGRNP